MEALVTNNNQADTVKSCISIESGETTTNKPRLRRKLIRTFGVKLSGVQVDLISDTLPVNLSIMDDTSKEMLKKKKYNEIVDELTTYM